MVISGGGLDGVFHFRRGSVEISGVMVKDGVGRGVDLERRRTDFDGQCGGMVEIHQATASRYPLDRLMQTRLGSGGSVG